MDKVDIMHLYGTEKVEIKTESNGSFLSQKS